MNFDFGIDHLTVSKALAVEKGQCRGLISHAAKERIAKSRKAVLEIAANETTVYGINTGFGPLCSTKISPEETSELQYNILKSHSVGVGEPISVELARLMLITKLHALCQGYSGISLSTLERMLWFLEEEITPVVPKQGSVGASGDLAPLAHLFLPLIGLGEVYYQGKKRATNEVLEIYGFNPIELGPKEGLALINGTQFILAHAILAVDKLYSALAQADIIGAMMIESLLGSIQPFRKDLHELRPFKGNQHVASRVWTLLKDSQILNSHIDCDKVQDPYSLRCIPQVHGSSRNTWLHLKELVEIELNAVTDNPIIFSQTDTVSGGNFHGQPLAMVLDYAALAASELGNISDRRIYLAIEGKTEGLPQLLMKNTGINSGFMLPQYTSAALASENKSLCFPSSADSIPTSLGQEDHVSMGSISGRKTLRILENLEQILAIELLCAAQAFDFRRPLKSGEMLEACHAEIRSRIDHADKDRVFAHDIRKAHDLIAERKLLEITAALKEKTDHHSEFEQY